MLLSVLSMVIDIESNSASTYNLLIYLFFLVFQNMSDTINNTTHVIFKFIIYMCWRDSILGKFQLSSFFFFLNPIFIPFRVSNIFKTKTKKSRSTITMKTWMKNKKESFFSFFFYYYYYLNFFSRSILVTQINLSLILKKWYLHGGI